MHLFWTKFLEVLKPKTSYKTSYFLLNNATFINVCPILNDAIFYRCLKKLQNIVQTIPIMLPTPRHGRLTRSIFPIFAMFEITIRNQDTGNWVLAVQLHNITVWHSDNSVMSLHCAWECIAGIQQDGFPNWYALWFPLPLNLNVAFASFHHLTWFF